MVIHLGPELEAALIESARRDGVTPEALALSVLGSHLRKSLPIIPRDDWERRLLSVATDCGVSLPDSAWSREEMYD